MSEFQLAPKDHSHLAAFKRALAPLETLATTVTVTSVMTGIVPLTQAAISSGGPAMMVFGFAFAGLMALSIALSLADIASGFPSVKGGLAEYSRRLAPDHLRRLAPWLVGWLHFFAFATGATSCAFSFALFATSAIEIAGGFVPQRWVTVLLHVFVSILFGAVNALQLNLDMYSIAWHVSGPIAIVMTIAASNKSPPSPGWVFSHFENETGWTSSFYVVLLGLMQGAFTMTGYDAPIHTMHSIENAALKIPKGILCGFLVSFTIGEMIIISLLFGINDINAILNPVISGLAPVEIFVLLIGRAGTACILVIFICTFFFCGQGIVKACSEIGHELAVSGAFPKATYMSQLGSKGQPARVGWVCAALSSTIGIMYLGDSTILQALTSAVAIELNLVYSIPIALRFFFPNPTRFQPGPFTLGRFQRPINMIAITWAVLGAFIFSLPGWYPITAGNMNYACVLLLITLSSILGYWYFSARHWYNLDPRDKAADCGFGSMSSDQGVASDATTQEDKSIEEKDLDEIENWLDHLERDLREL
ncbi:hypothetical protein BGZ67_007773 [Mortierella alpina]|nr:hypothetical protein BGZ67_007773 [Mortierella alpina]